MQGFSSAPVREGPLAGVPPAGLRKIWTWGILIALGGFLFGFDTGVISGALLFVRTDFGLNSFQQGTVVSVLVLGAMAGALTSGRIADRFGRRRALEIEGLVFLVGTVVAVFAPGYGTLLAGRLILGLAVGAASATVPIYLSELAPKDIRGRLLTLNQLMITVGILVAYLVNLAFSGSGDWRAMIAVGSLPALLIVVAAVLILPESGVWLLQRGRRGECRELIASVTDTATADRLIERYDRRTAEEAERGEPHGTGPRALAARRVRPALAVGLVLAALQQFAGINTIIYYAPTIIERTGLTASNAIAYSIAIGVINLLMTIVAIRAIDRAGRRRLMVASLAVMTVTMVLLGLSFVAGWPSELSLVFMVVYIAGYAAGLGPVFWTMIGEIFPARVHAAGSSASTAVNWASNFAVSLAFLPIASAIGQGETFWIFAAISLLGLLFVVRYVPETKGREYERIDADLQHRFGRRPTEGAAVR
ncbi:sugar porter family MFS transporter [Actinomadura sp. WMMB 499]|uniref:sugar porter family MFS transporter n=1 Tax=Actinomadura sp. WMMB 499 TaxID=1219491 RepID=UPI0012457609|nr:sugar porter family MFS transporter [Actinomadura sp. WMMB 499]QFG20170.1 sugar porter family MFS transporter [Actinomadura sp. WMMB 499]